MPISPTQVQNLELGSWQSFLAGWSARSSSNTISRDFFGALGRRLDLQAVRDLALARGGEHALALDLDHAGAAVAVGAVAGLGQPAQMRDLLLVPLGDLPDGLAGLGLDLLAIELEGDLAAHLSSLSLNALPGASLTLDLGKRLEARLFQILREELDHGHQRIGSRLAEAADRGIGHDLRQVLEQGRVPRLLRHKLNGLLGAIPAGRALAAALVLEELHEVQGYGLHIVLVGQNDNRVASRRNSRASRACRNRAEYRPWRQGECRLRPRPAGSP